MRPLGGLKIEDVVEGSGDVADRGAVVSVEWRGWLNRGDGFGGGTNTFRVGGRRLIAGFERGVVGMRVGGVRRLRISPHLGYRDRAAFSVPADAVLNFEIKLLGIGPAARSDAATDPGGEIPR